MCFFGVLIYIGCHREPNRVFWEEGKPDSLIHAIRHSMSINLLENLRRYLHISDAGDLKDEEEEYEEVEEEGEREGDEVEEDEGIEEK